MAAKKGKEEKTFNQVVSLEQARKQRAPLTKEERLKAIASTMAQVNKAHGEGAIQKMGDRAEQVYPHIPSGIVTLDAALGIGGIPTGRIIEVFGPESAGKTTTCLAFVAHCQKEGGIAAIVDAEHAFDPAFAKKIGVNIDELLVSQPSNGEEALELVESLVRSNSVNLIVVDSVAALVPKAELEGDMGAAQMGLQARLMSQAMRKLTAISNLSDTSVVFINQIRNKIGVMYGSPETTTGGLALKFYASVRMDVRRADQIKNGDEVIGNRVRVKIIKNKMAPPFRVAEYNLFFDRGFDYEGSVIDSAVQMGVVERAGAWYSFDGTKIGQGLENSCKYLKENPEAYAKVRDKVIEKLKQSKDLSFGEKKEVDGKTVTVDNETGEILDNEA